MFRAKRFATLTGALAASAALAAMPASAQAPSLAGKNVQMIIGFGPGGGYDLWGRTLSLIHI